MTVIKTALHVTVFTHALFSSGITPKHLETLNLQMTLLGARQEYKEILRVGPPHLVSCNTPLIALE